MVCLFTYENGVLLWGNGDWIQAELHGTSQIFCFFLKNNEMQGRRGEKSEAMQRCVLQETQRWRVL